MTILFILLALTMAAVLIMVGHHASHINRAIDQIGNDLLELRRKQEDVEQLKAKVAEMEAAATSAPAAPARIYTAEIRATTLEYVKANIHHATQKTIAEMLGIPRSTLSSWINEWKKEGLLPVHEVTFTPSPEVAQQLNLEPQE